MNIPIKIKRLREGVRLPEYATDGSAGMDVYANSDLSVPGNSTMRVDCGFSVEVPEGYELQVRSRSGLAFRGLTVANSPGTIDSDYRGEIGVLLNSCDYRGHEFNVGDRVAQLVLAPVYKAAWVEVDELSETVRGEGGFGSTGE